MAVKCAGDTELGLDAHNSPLHVIEGTGCLTATVASLACGQKSAASQHRIRRLMAGLIAAGALCVVHRAVGGFNQIVNDVTAQN